MYIPAALTLFIFGAIIGSFLNVVVMRYELLGSILATKRIGGRSRCPQCRTELRWFELIPLFSFILQGRRCRHCSYRLSWQYPTVELLSALLTTAIPLALYNRFDIAALSVSGESIVWFVAYCGLWLVATYTFIVLSLIDLKYTIIPDAANVLLGIVGVALVALRFFYEPLMSYHGSFLGNFAVFMPLFGSSVIGEALIAAGVGAAFFGGIILLTRGRGMGLGDLKLIIPIGLMMGWPDTALVIAASFIIGAFISVFLMLFARKSLKDGVPFGPFLTTAVFAIILYGEALLNWYFSIL